MYKTKVNPKPLFLLTLLALVLAFVAMKGGPAGTALAQGGTAAATQPPTPVPSATPKPLGSQEGTLTIWSDKDRATMFEKVGADFTKKYNIPVRVQQMGFGDVRGNLTLAAPVGEGPDLALSAHDWLGQFVANGVVEELDLGAKLKDFDPVAIRAFSYNGKLYGMPYSTEAIALYYNKDLVPEPPKTWKEAIDLAQKLVADKKVDQGFAFPTGGGDPYHHYPLITGFGGYIFGANKDGSYNPDDLGLDSPGGLKAAAELDRLVKAGVLRPEIDANQLFKSGKLAMYVSGPWNLSDFRKAGIKFGVAKIPAMDGPARPFVGSNGIVVNKFSKNLLLAKAFLTEFVATNDAMQLIYDAVPANIAYLPFKANIKDVDLAAFGASAADGQPMPAIPQMAAVWTAWGNAITLIYQQKGAPDQLFKDAAKSIRDELAKKK